MRPLVRDWFLLFLKTFLQLSFLFFPVCRVSTTGRYSNSLSKSSRHSSVTSPVSIASIYNQTYCIYVPCNIDELGHGTLILSSDRYCSGGQNIDLLRYSKTTQSAGLRYVWAFDVEPTTCTSAIDEQDITNVSAQIEDVPFPAVTVAVLRQH